MRAICMTQIALLSPFACTGGSKISFTTRAMSRYAKTHRAFEKIRASSREFEASPTIFSGSINPTQSRKTATPPLSAVSNPYFL